MNAETKIKAVAALTNTKEVVAPVKPKATQTEQEAVNEATKNLSEKDEENIAKVVTAKEKDQAVLEAAISQKAEEKKENAEEAANLKRFEAESAALAAARAKPTAEEEKAKLDAKMAAINAAAEVAKKARIAKEKADAEKAEEDDDKRKRRILDGFKAEVKRIEAETAQKNALEAAVRAAAAASTRHLSDEEWVANMPEHHFK